MSRISDAIDYLDLKGWISTYTDVKSTDGPEFRICCPECDNKKYKLYINEHKKLWVCHVCQFGRGIRDVVVLLSAVSGRTSISIISELVQTVAPIKDSNFTFVKDSEVPDAVAEVVSLPGTTNFKSMVGTAAMNYAKARGLCERDVSLLKLTASSKLTHNGNSLSGPFLIFPVFFQGDIVAYQGRRIYEVEPKYVSYGNIKKFLWPLDKILYDVFDGTVCITEGVFDALGLIKKGIPAVCTFGKSLSKHQINLLLKMNLKSITFAWDLDAENEIMAAINNISGLFSSVNVADFSSTYKIDPGDALLDDNKWLWVKERIDSAVDYETWCNGKVNF